MATPHVAAVGALVWSYNRSCSAQDIRRILLASTKPLGDGCNHEYGRGLVQAKQAVEMIQTGCDAADGYGIFASTNGLNEGNLCDGFVLPPTYPDCLHGERMLQITILSGVLQTSWELTNANNMSQVALGDGYSNVPISRTVPLCFGESYTFTITDSGLNDGSGSYMLELDSEVLKPHGSQVPTGSSEATVFEVGCLSGMEMITVDILTDRYPGETTWELKETITGTIMYAGGPYSELETQHFEHMCITQGGLYDFSIFDSYGDGICCSYGNGEYVAWCGDEMMANGGQFGNSESSTFQVPTGPISEEPSMAPSKSQEPSSQPSGTPSIEPSDKPSLTPTESSQPSLTPSFEPSESSSPSDAGTPSPTVSLSPSFVPSMVPSQMPSNDPSQVPSNVPSMIPSQLPSDSPTKSLVPSVAPSGNPTHSASPSQVPSDVPSRSLAPSMMPSNAPSASPAPSGMPSISPSAIPTSSFQGLALWDACRDKECTFNVRNDETIIFTITEMSIMWPQNAGGYLPELREIKEGGTKLWKDTSTAQPTVIDSWLELQERQIGGGDTIEYKLKFEKNANLVEDVTQYAVFVTLESSQSGTTATIPVVEAP